jgi:hypothetical protein
MGSIPGMETFPQEMQKMFARMGEIMAPVRTHDQPVFPVKVEGGNILVDLE